MASQQYMQQQAQAVDAIIFKLRVYRDPQRLRNDALELLRNTPSLQPRSGPMPRPPGQGTGHVLYLTGTVPIFYNKAQYNIPVNIWVVEAYPLAPPVCYVTPVQGMVIKNKHKHVDSTGMCYLPYLSNWNANSSNLVGLVGVMSSIFSEDPPVRSQASQPAQPQPPQKAVQPAYPPPSAYSYGQPTQQPVQQPPYGASPAPGKAFEDPQVVAKRNATRQVTEKIQAKLHIFNQQTTKEMDALMVKESEMSSSKGNVELDAIQKQKEQMDADIEGLTRNFEEISKWIDANGDTNGVDIDAVTEPKDALSKQLLHLVAEDASVEDVLYYLEKKMIKGDVPLEQYLKNVRNLSTEQFVARATIKKVHEKQRAR